MNRWINGVLLLFLMILGDFPGVSAGKPEVDEVGRKCTPRGSRGISCSRRNSSSYGMTREAGKRTLQEVLDGDFRDACFQQDDGYDADYSSRDSFSFQNDSGEANFSQEQYEQESVVIDSQEVFFEFIENIVREPNREDEFIECLSNFLDENAVDLNQEVFKKKTALIIVIEKRLLKTVATLLEYGADSQKGLDLDCFENFKNTYLLVNDENCSREKAIFLLLIGYRLGVD